MLLLIRTLRTRRGRTENPLTIFHSKIPSSFSWRSIHIENPPALSSYQKHRSYQTDLRLHKHSQKKITPPKRASQHKESQSTKWDFGAIDRPSSYGALWPPDTGTKRKAADGNTASETAAHKSRGWWMKEAVHFKWGFIAQRSRKNPPPRWRCVSHHHCPRASVHPAASCRPGGLFLSC
jgi:hypothetical protein